MNLVALLVAPTVVKYGVHGPHQNNAVRIIVGVLALGLIVGAVVVSKRRKMDMGPTAGVPAVETASTPCPPRRLRPGRCRPDCSIRQRRNVSPTSCAVRRTPSTALPR